jgi:hypothetical protein
MPAPEAGSIVRAADFTSKLITKVNCVPYQGQLLVEPGYAKHLCGIA